MLSHQVSKRRVGVLSVTACALRLILMVVRESHHKIRGSLGTLACLIQGRFDARYTAR